MEMQPPKRLSDVLRRHAEGGHLREAFDRVNAMRDTRTYDRTTLPRWLSGESTPSDEKFIGRLPAAEIRLFACLPYPADLSMYPVMLGAYAVAGRAEITMVTDPECAGRPHALCFLGQTRSWERPDGFDGRELSVEIGENDSLIEQNSGVVFFWHSAPIGSGG
jgi:hypothetical protein